jgi:hypothetical protein
MNKIANKLKSLWNDESAQGATEYILLLVVVVGIAVVFGPRIKTIMQGKMDEVAGGIDKLKVE